MAVLYLFAFADHVLIKTLMHLLCCAMCQICFCCLFIAGCLASILIPFHLPGQCLSASALKRWEETSVTHQSWFDTENAFGIYAFSTVIYEVFCVSFHETAMSEAWSSRSCKCDCEGGESPTEFSTIGTGSSMVRGLDCMPGTLRNLIQRPTLT